MSIGVITLTDGSRWHWALHTPLDRITGEPKEPVLQLSRNGGARDALIIPLDGDHYQSGHFTEPVLRAALEAALAHRAAGRRIPPLAPEVDLPV